MALEYFPCYHSYRRKIAKLSDQEVGRLFKALLDYSETGEAQELTGRESIAFDFIADDIDRAKESYQAKCEQNRRNRGGTTVDERPRTITTVDERPQNKGKSKDKSKSKSKESPFAAFAAGDDALTSAFNGFAQMRVKIKAPLTDRAEELLITKLQDLSGGDRGIMAAILDQSTERGWRGVFALKKDAAANTIAQPGESEIASMRNLERLRDAIKEGK